jgi:pyruvate/2-oxoacid:ferredoxin oxidoreductase alpha subunit
MAKGAVQKLRNMGVKAGLFRPITVWPFPIDLLKPALKKVRRIVMVEASPGQLEDELRLALSHAGVEPPLIDRVQRYGGFLPSQDEILEGVLKGEEVGK